jgi:gluconolactonase
MSFRSAFHVGSNNYCARTLVGAIALLGCAMNVYSQAVSAIPQNGVLANVPGSAIDRLDPALDTIIAPNTKIDRVATGFKFLEGPMWHMGRLWFSDLVGNKLYAVSPDGKVEMLMDHSGGLDSVPPGAYMGSNAMVTDKVHSVLLIQHGKRRIARLDRNLTASTFLDRFENKRLNSPNDLVFAPDGSLWFTDPPFGLPKQNNDPAKELPFNGVYRYANGKLIAVIKDLPMPNGIGFSADGKTLYVSNSGPKMGVQKYSVSSSGEVTGGTSLISYPGSAPDVPDGLKIDSAGNVWTTGPGGIRIITPSGKVLGQIKLPEVAANLAWAEDGKTLYITASTSVYRLKTLMKGALPLYH